MMQYILYTPHPTGGRQKKSGNLDSRAAGFWMDVYVYLNSNSTFDNSQTRLGVAIYILRVIPPQRQLRFHAQFKTETYKNAECSN